MMTAKYRWVLWIVLLAGLAGYIFADTPSAAPPRRPAIVQAHEPAPVLEMVTPSSEPVAPLADLTPRHTLVQRRPGLGRDPFTPRDWTPPPPPPAPIPATVPTAPPLPYTYVGKKHEAGVWEVYLARGERAFIVREGATLEGTYRVDRIAPPTLTLTYQPLEQLQSLPIGEP